MYMHAETDSYILVAYIPAAGFVSSCILVWFPDPREIKNAGKKKNAKVEEEVRGGRPFAQTLPPPSPTH